MGWIIVGVLSGLVAIDLVIHGIAALLILPLFERKIPFGVRPSPPDPDAEPVSFPTTHGLTLRGGLYRQRDANPLGLVIFCPELEGNHWSALTYAEALWKAGFDVLAFDFRNQGESDCLPGYDPLHWLTEYEVSDVLAAVAYVRSRSDLRHLPLGLLGISRGGGAALAAAARCRQVRCIACEGVFSTDGLMLHYTLRWASLYAPHWLLRLFPIWHIRWTLQITRLLSRLRKRCRWTNLERRLLRLRDRPVLMIAGARDTYVPPEITQSLCRRIGRSCRSVWIVPDAKHNMAREVAPAEYDHRLVEFFSRMTRDRNPANIRPSATA